MVIPEQKMFWLFLKWQYEEEKLENDINKYKIV